MLNVLHNRASLLSLLLIGVMVLSGCIRIRGTTALRVVEESEHSTSGSEYISHYHYLYDGYTKISRVSTSSISPSGDFAAFENDGAVMLYRRGSLKPENVTDGQFALPQTFKWNEEKAILEIVYFQDSSDPLHANHPPSTISLK